MIRINFLAGAGGKTNARKGAGRIEDGPKNAPRGKRKKRLPSARRAARGEKAPLQESHGDSPLSRTIPIGARLQFAFQIKGNRVLSGVSLHSTRPPPPLIRLFRLGDFFLPHLPLTTPLSAAAPRFYRRDVYSGMQDTLCRFYFASRKKTLRVFHGRLLVYLSSTLGRVLLCSSNASPGNRDAGEGRIRGRKKRRN